MSSLLFLITASFFNPAEADIGPPPSCPSGEYRTYLRGHQCVKNGYVLVDLSDFDIPWEIVDKIETGEVVIPNLDTSDITIRRGTLEVKKEDEGKVTELLKNFDKTKLEEKTGEKEPVKEAEKEPVKEDVEEALKATKKTTGDTDVKIVEENKEVASAQNNSNDCSNVSASQSLILLLCAFIFSGFRRRL